MARNYWAITISDPETGESKYLTAATKFDLNLKMDRQYAIWERRAERLKKLNTIEELKEEADELDKECQEDIESLKNILKNEDSYLTPNDFFKLESSKYRYPSYKCSKDRPSIEKVFSEMKVPKKRSIIEFIFKKVYFNRVLLEDEAKQEFMSRTIEYDDIYKRELDNYIRRKEEFERDRILRNLVTTLKHELFNKGDKELVEMYAKEMLLNYNLPDYITDVLNQFEMQYQFESKILIISRMLPTPDLLPEYSGYKYVSLRKSVDGVKWKQKDLDKFYEDMIFQIALKTVRDLFLFINESTLDMVVFNGWVNYIDTSKGKPTTSCIISLEVERKSINEINFLLVNDYKNCIKGLKGIFNPNIKELKPIVPILEINRKDKRFINNVDITSILYDGFNLATMEWEDFEYLIRQLFEKIFSYNNSEVRVTQASRDGGVDAIAFDPDPIRGGKFVIQAKRYNILVPVSAVRDLYGTMIHEGATRGILVTTSNFGKDAYKFSREKSITLINGSELLGLLHTNGFNNTKIELNR